MRLLGDMEGDAQRAEGLVCGLTCRPFDLDSESLLDKLDVSEYIHFYFVLSKPFMRVSGVRQPIARGSGAKGFCGPIACRPDGPPPQRRPSDGLHQPTLRDAHDLVVASCS